ncbi:MAG: hypothetical protein KDA95_04795 [Acidimicrobiales bacterium]|nr:hypothetical protein [Acidimicrobiales bacterium]
MNVVIGRMDTNADIFKAILDDTAYAEDLKLNYGRDLYRQIHGQKQALKRARKACTSVSCIGWLGVDPTGGLKGKRGGDSGSKPERRSK